MFALSGVIRDKLTGSVRLRPFVGEGEKKKGFEEGSLHRVCVCSCVWNRGGYKDPSVGESDRKPPEQLILSL